VLQSLDIPVQKLAAELVTDGANTWNGWQNNSVWKEASTVGNATAIKQCDVMHDATMTPF
jgi:hypothetical protein